MDLTQEETITALRAKIRALETQRAEARRQTWAEAATILDAHGYDIVARIFRERAERSAI